MTPTLTATLITTIAITVYALACWVIPFGRCHACKATGTRTTWITRRLRPCRRCKGSGRKLRYGRRAYNHLHHINRDAATAARSRSDAR
jgi:hypothetical protein